MVSYDHPNRVRIAGRDNKAAVTDSAITNLDTLTITALEQTATNTLVEITFNSTWSQGQADTVDKNFKELADQVVTQRAVNTALQATLNAVLATLRANGLLDS